MSGILPANNQPSQELGDLPLSQETFHILWDQLQSDASSGFVLQDPVQVNLNNYDFGEAGGNVIQENQVEFQVEHLQMEPQMPSLNNMPSLPSLPSMPSLSGMHNLTSESSFLEQLNSSLPPQQTVTERSPGSAMPSSTGYASATETATTPPPPTFTPPLNPNAQLPSNVPYPGDYEFEINLGQPTSQAAKSVSWTYSPMLNKLFVDRDKPCPIQFKTVAPPPTNCFIRVLPIFKQAENLAEVVGRCPNHIGTPDEYSMNHLVLCSDPRTSYYTDQSNGRHSLVVPYTTPQVGAEYSKYLFIFKCFISCVGGLNRRKIQLVFTLENENGGVIGRQVLDIRVCACPGRDRKAEEKQYEKSKAPQKKPQKRGASKVTSSVGVTSFTKKKKTDEETFFIAVQGREKYELLMRIKESLDLMDLVTPNQVAQYRSQSSQQQQQINQHLQLPNGVPNLPRVSSFSSTTPSTSQGNALTPPISMNRSQSFPTQQQQPQMQQQQPQQRQVQFAPQTTTQPQYSNNMEVYTPSTSTSLQRQDTRPCKDEADGPNSMEVDAIPTSQGFGLLSNNIQLSPPKPCHSSQNHTPPPSSQDTSIFGWLTRLGMKEYADIFTQKNVQTIDQLDEINLEDLTNVPQQARESLWKSILDMKHGLHLGPSSLLRTSSSASTASVRSSGGSLGGNQVYSATRFTLKQTLSFKVEKDDD